jgi:F-type H+-transporting ATPase subunit delta
VTADQLSEMTYGFNNLLITKGREGFLPEIANAFINQYKEYNNIQVIKLTTAAPISDTMRDSIIGQIKKSAGYEKIEVEEKVDPDLIGGFVLQVGDQLVDASIAYDLKEVSRQFENNDFIYKIR